MITVKQVLHDKGNPELWTVSPNTTVYDALKMLSQKRVGALPVVENEELVGILSERDYARKVILKGKSSLNTPVREIMTEKVFCVEPDQSMQACMELMTEKRVRHLPVLTNGKLTGIISIGDVLKEIISEQETFIRDLQNYIEGREYSTASKPATNVAGI
jgi:CBS domain-containing protein